LAPNRNAARVLADFVVSKEDQRSRRIDNFVGDGVPVK
jgi:hypothetical protein